MKTRKDWQIREDFFLKDIYLFLNDRKVIFKHWVFPLRKYWTKKTLLNLAMVSSSYSKVIQSWMTLWNLDTLHPVVLENSSSDGNSTSNLKSVWKSATKVPIILDAVNGINGNNGWHFHDSTIGVECCYSPIYHFFVMSSRRRLDPYPGCYQHPHPGGKISHVP